MYPRALKISDKTELRQVYNLDLGFNKVYKVQIIFIGGKYSYHTYDSQGPEKKDHLICDKLVLDLVEEFEGPKCEEATVALGVHNFVINQRNTSDRKLQQIQDVITNQNMEFSDRVETVKELLAKDE